MRHIIFMVLFSISAVSRADVVRYMGIEPLRSGDLSFRDTWDSTGQFCYISEESKKCLKLTDMGEVKLRDQGEWQKNTDLSFLGDDLRKQAENYDRVFVRYLAVGAQNDFVVHVFFVHKGSSERYSQTIFAFGKIEDDGQRKTARVRGMAFSEGLELLGALFGLHRTRTKEQLANLDEAGLHAEIVRDQSTLLGLGQAVVEKYLNQSSEPVVKPIQR